MLGVLSLKKLLLVSLRISTKARQKSSVSFHRLQIQLIWIIINLVERVGVGFSPAVGASKIACIHIWRHLHTSVTFDPVECALVARTIGNQTLLGPMAYFHATMLAYQLVFLLGELCRDSRLYLSHVSLHDEPHSVSRRGDVSRSLRMSK